MAEYVLIITCGQIRGPFPYLPDWSSVLCPSSESGRITLFNFLYISIFSAVRLLSEDTADHDNPSVCLSNCVKRLQMGWRCDWWKMKPPPGWMRHWFLFDRVPIISRINVKQKTDTFEYHHRQWRKHNRRTSIHNVNSQDSLHGSEFEALFPHCTW